MVAGVASGARRTGGFMKTRRGSLFGIAIVAAFFAIAAFMLVPGFATLLGQAIASLWVTVIGALAGIVGGLFGA